MWRFFNMKKYNYLGLILFLLFLFITPNNSFGNYKGKQNKKDKKPKLNKTAEIGRAHV